MSQLSPAGHMAATLLLILLASAAAAAVSADQQVSACQNDIDALWRSCKQFVQKEGPKMPPSEDCCKTIKALDAHASLHLRLRRLPGRQE
uniref:Lipid binding protein n=1 Tax=Zea mays TaxID=4577 RepID=B6T194_MAIZE|nr:lipid binding protein [Zea mays]